MYRKIILAAALGTVVLCSLTIIGWCFDVVCLRSMISGTAPMKLNTAITFVLFGFALLTARKSSLYAIHLSLIGASILLPFLTLLQYIFTVDFGIDQAIFQDQISNGYGMYPGRISPAACYCFIILNISLLAVNTVRFRFRPIAQYGFHTVTLIGIIALLGYIYKVPIMYKMSTFSSIAVHTGLLLIITSTAASFLNPELGITGLFTGKGMGNTMARSLVPTLVLILFILSFIRIELHRFGLVSVEFGIVLFTTSFLVVILFMVIVTATQLNKIDAKKRLIEESYLILNKNLEQKIVERSAQFKEIKERFEMATDSAHIGIWEVDLATQQLDGNEFFFMFLALDPHGPVPQEKLYENMHPEDAPKLKQEIEQAILGRSSSTNFTCRVIFPDQSTYHIKVMYTVKKDDTGKPARIYGASIDVTSQIKFEEELRQQYGRIKAFVKEAPAMLALLDSEFKFMAVSDLWLHEFLGSTDEVLNLSIEKVMPKLWNSLEEKFLECQKGITFKSDAEKLVKENGDECWLKYVLAPWYDSVGKIGGVMVKLLDITKQKKQEIELLVAKERLSLATEVSGVGVYEWDVVSGYFYVDDIMSRLYGFEKLEPKLANAKISSTIHPEDLKELGVHVESLFSNPNAFRLDAEYRVIWPDASVHYIRSKGTIVRDLQGTALTVVGTNVDITLQKTVEQQLMKGYNTIKTFIEGAPSAIAMLDNNLRYLAASNQWLKDYKLTFTNIIGYSHYDIFPEISEFWKGLHQACLEGETVQSEGERFLRADGTEQWIKYVICPWYDTTGEVGGIIMHTSDITEQRKAVDELMQTKERLQLATEASKVGIWDWNLTNDFLYWDEQMYKLYGVDPSKAGSSDSKWKDRVHPDDIERVKSELGMAIKGLLEFDTEFRVIWPSGIIRHIKAKAIVQRDAKDKAQRMVGTNLDITQQKVQLETLRQSEERYFKMVNEVQDYAIVLLDNKGKIENWNFGAQKIFDYSAAEIVGSSLDIFFTPEDLQEDKVNKLFMTALESGRSQDEGWRIRKNGNLFLGNTSLTALHGMHDEIIGFSMLTHDLTERKKAELSEKMEAKNKELEQITYIASHDLQEPLRTISGIVNIMNLQYEHKLDDEADKYLKFMKEASERMRNLIKGLLDYSRIGKGNELNYFDSGEVLNEIRQDLSVFIGESHAKLIAIGNLPYVKGYRTEFRLLLQNLISNAIKFRKKDCDPEIVISAVKENNCWKFSLKDNGIGIDPKYQEKIFMIFQRLHNRSEYEGTGIGLSHCKKIVELHGGRIWVDSYVGEGSTFYFTIPN